MAEIVMDDEKQKMLKETLQLYGLSEADTELIRHNENLTFRIDRQYLLRIHKHKSGFTSDAIYEGLDRAQIYESELSFLQHLKRCGLHVQNPIRNLNGIFVSRLSDGTPATMLSWLDGHIVEKSELSRALCREIGAMTARIHHAARRFAAVPALRYDFALCERLKRKLQELVGNGALTADDGNVLAAALDTAGDFLSKAEEDFILVHSDLSLSNMLITDTALAPIDFSLFGYSHPMMDISALFCNISGSSNRQAILDGYLSEGGTIDTYAIDCTYALNVLLGIILHCDLWTNEAWFAEKLAGWKENIFVPLAQGRSVVDLSIRVVCAEEKDIPAWLSLVQIVSEDFPGLSIDEYTQTLKKNIARKTALCEKEDGKIAGILLFSPHQQCLSCMAVHPGYRRSGIAAALIEEMLRLMPNGDISVNTFREGDAKGVAPRSLYRKFGFQPDELLIEFDYPVQRLILKRTVQASATSSQV